MQNYFLQSTAVVTGVFSQAFYYFAHAVLSSVTCCGIISKGTMASPTNFHTLDDDWRRLVNGLKQEDAFMIQRTLPYVQQHIDMLDQALLSCDVGNDREFLLKMRNYMLHLIDSSSETLSNLLNGYSNRENKAAVATIAELDEKLVLRLRQSGLPWSKIGEVFSLSRQSMYNYRKEYDFHDPLIELSDAELEARLLPIIQSFPAAGAVSVRGILLANGLKVNVNKVKAALRKIDPAAVQRRRRQKIRRRAYWVPAANHMWHIDGMHKLNMFRIVVHGCIDGFSRLITHLYASTNNEKETVRQLFEGSVKEYGLPSRVRADKGTENFSVGNFMNAVRGEGRGSFMTGPSTHNTRIERLWRDVNEQISFHYKDIFLFLEDSGVLDEDNVIDIFCLYYVYLPRLNFHLTTFKNGFNRHSMRTIESQTPEQRWLIDMIMDGSDVNDGASVYLSYDPNYWSQTHIGTFGPEVGENEIVDMLNRSIIIVPDPTIDDHDAGMSHYRNLRNYFYSLFRMY